jgi:hypothetical protein
MGWNLHVMSNFYWRRRVRNYQMRSSQLAPAAQINWSRRIAATTVGSMMVAASRFARLISGEYNCLCESSTTIL